MKNVATLILICFCCFSCDQYLDENPDNRKEIETLEDVADLVANSYNQATYLFVEWMTDNVTAIDDNTQQEHMSEAFKWEPIDSYEAQESPSYFWSNAYYAIAHANEALAVIDNFNGDETFKLAIKGEALISRAYNHFLLVNVFAKHYNAESANTDIGIPYVDEVEDEFLKKYTRQSVQKVYNLIERDLLIGLRYLSDDYFVGSKKYHFTKEAAYAFATRFYLFRKEYDKCILYCNKLLGGGQANSVYIRDLYNIFKGSTFDEMAAKYSDSNENGNLLLIRKETFFARENYGYRSNSEKYAEIFSDNLQGENDIRNQQWSLGTSAVFAPKYNELFRYTTNDTGLPYFIQSELKGEEVLLNRMESFIMTGEFQRALDDYHVLAAKRYENGGLVNLDLIKNYYSELDTKKAMLSFVIDERRKEFVDEALRWFDIKRFSIPLTHISLDGEIINLQANDNKTAVQIPQTAINNGLQPNLR
nr:RagB/SusD family nutrient uptake outer membrane protein [uncultured Marinifilum sp.]